MSKLNEVLKVLGLKVGKEFLLFKNGEKIPGRYHFTDTGKLVVRTTAAGDIYVDSMYSLYDLIVRDDLKLEPVPFVPKDGERFYTATPKGKVRDDNFNPTMSIDHFRLATGFCFRTEEEARENIDKYVKLMQDIRDGAKLVLKKDV